MFLSILFFYRDNYLKGCAYIIVPFGFPSKHNRIALCVHASIPHNTIQYNTIQYTPVPYSFFYKASIIDFKSSVNCSDAELWILWVAPGYFVIRKDRVWPRSVLLFIIISCWIWWISFIRVILVSSHTVIDGSANNRYIGNFLVVGIIDPRCVHVLSPWSVAKNCS